MKLILVRIALLLLVALCTPFLSLRAGLAPPDGERLPALSRPSQMHAFPLGTVASLALLSSLAMSGLAYVGIMSPRT